MGLDCERQAQLDWAGFVISGVHLDNRSHHGAWARHRGDTTRVCTRVTKPRPARARARARRASHARSKGSAATSRRAQTAPTKPFPPPGIIGWAGDGRFDLVDRAAQRDVCRQLRAINIDPVALVHELAGDADVAALVAELRAARHEVLWRRIAPSHMRFWRLFEALDPEPAGA